MTWASFGAFAVATIALCVVPGPAVMLVLSQALSHGPAKAVWSILGITAAGVVWFALSATGIGAILVASYDLFFAIKWIGVVYLVWLGVGTLLRSSGFRSAGFALPGPATGSAEPARLFWGGFVLQMANPNVLLFFTAFLPQFIAPRAPLLPQIVILAAATAVVELVVQLGYAYLAGRFKDLLAASRFARIADRVAGSLLILAGIATAAIRRT
ncbi:MAG TPA: LysE family translocator [Rhizomicrobium sp.]|nr:LysE family translocator [Rhizomicrobium sp.]